MYNIVFIFVWINKSIILGCFVIIWSWNYIFSIFFFLIKRKEIDFNFIKCILVFFSIVLVIIIGFKNIRFVHYDDFFNWGYVSRNIFENNQLLVENNSYTYEINNYIPAIPLFIYFISRFLGYTEANCIIIKNIFAIATILPFFTFVDKKNKLSYITPIITVFISLFGVIIYDCKTILVDIIQATLSVSLFIYIYINRNNIKKRDIIIFMIISIVLYMIKASSVIYLFFNFMLCIIFNVVNYKENKNIKKYIISTIILIILILLCMISWRIYSYKYTNNITKFNLNIEQWKANYEYKIQEFENKKYELSEENNTFLQYFIKNYTSRIFSIKFICFELLIITEISVLLLLFIHKLDKNNALKLALIMLIMYLIYSISYFLIYLFMMNFFEDVILSAIERYFGQLLVYFIGIIFVLKNIYINNKSMKNNSNNIIITIYIVMLLLIQIILVPSIFNNFDYKLFFDNTENNEHIKKIRNISGITDIDKSSNLDIIYDNIQDPYYYSVVVVKYLLRTQNVVTNEYNVMKIWDEYYIVNLKDIKQSIYTENGTIEIEPYSIYHIYNEDYNNVEKII